MTTHAPSPLTCSFSGRCSSALHSWRMSTSMGCHTGSGLFMRTCAGAGGRQRCSADAVVRWTQRIPQWLGALPKSCLLPAGAFPPPQRCWPPAKLTEALCCASGCAAAHLCLEHGHPVLARRATIGTQLQQCRGRALRLAAAAQQLFAWRSGCSLLILCDRQHTGSRKGCAPAAAVAAKRQSASLLPAPCPDS